MKDVYLGPAEVLERLYLENSGFQEYVDRYCKIQICTRQQAFKHMIVREVAEQYMKGDR